FFGLWLFPFGLLVIRSGFIPRILGYLLIIAGSSYVLGSLNFVLSPPFGNVVSIVVGVGYLGELGVVVWLLVTAVRVQFGHTRNWKPLERRVYVGGCRWGLRRGRGWPAQSPGSAQGVVASRLRTSLCAQCLRRRSRASGRLTLPSPSMRKIRRSGSGRS